MAERSIVSASSTLTPTGLIVSADQIRNGTAKLPEWAGDVFTAFQHDLLSEERLFPCIFGVEALKQNNLRFAFLEDPRQEASLHILKEALIEYTGMYQTLGRMTSFAAMFKPEATVRTLDEYRDTFWHVLQFLHEHDPAPWPAEIPTDTRDPLWEFCFNNDPIFVVCNTPVHSARASRHSRSFMITFQPRWVFAGLGDTPRGENARRAIRARLNKYDLITPYPALGAYGDVNNREWKQYFLPDSNDVELTECPFKH